MASQNLAEAFVAYGWGIDAKNRIARMLMQETESRFTMSPKDGGILAALVASCPGDHFEIGMLQGGSAILAASAKQKFMVPGRIFGCDPFGWSEGQSQIGPMPSPETVLFNARLFGVENRIYPHRHAHPPLPHELKGARFDTCFIDGDHTYEAAAADWDAARMYTDKYVLFHDVHNRNHGCWKVFEEACDDPEWELFYKEDKMGVVKWK